MDRNGYIGRAPADSSVIVARQIFSPTGVTTNFTFNSGYTPGYIDLYLNGARLVEGTDYTATDTSTISVLNGGAENGDVLEGVAYKAFNLANDRIGIQSAGVSIGNAQTLNFIGVGNTFLVNGTTVDVSIQGGGGSGVASTITVADESSDTTCFPVFVTAATGDLNPKSGSNLTFNSSNGTLTATTFSGALTGNVTGNIAGATGSFTGNVSVGGTLTYEDVTNVDSVGLVTARTGVRVNAGGLIVTAGVSTLAADLSIADKIVHTGDTNTAIRFPAADTFTVETAGSERLRITSNGNIGINSIPSTKLDIYRSGSGVVGRFGKESIFGELFVAGEKIGLQGTRSSDSAVSGFFVENPSSTGTSNFELITIKTAGTERLRIASSGQIGLGGANYGTSGQVILSNGAGSAPTWGDVPAAGLTTEAATPNNAVATLNLTAAQDHKVTASGITTITVSGGTEADSHTVRIINSGITTVGFSTFFLFPSGSAPALPTASGAISLISFTVNRVGAGGTQLLAGASVNYS